VPVIDTCYHERCQALAEPFSAALLEWYRSHGRPLPWRDDPSPYHTWISEIMLQQTQVATVLPYYERFLARYPDVETLAASSLSELLALWQGLGYYSRARNLHAAAGEIVHRYGGQIPRERAELMSLPGVGDYTAGAILSIAYNQDYVAVDGNVKRILARILDFDRDLDTGANTDILIDCTRSLLPSGKASAFNQALMDLGATICTPRAPLCGACPVSRHCLATERRVQELRPVRSARRSIALRDMVGAIVQDDKGRWLAAHRIPRGLLGGLWEIPAFGLTPESDQNLEAVLTGALLEALALGVTPIPPPYTVSHAYTHFRVRLTVYACMARSVPVLRPHPIWDEIRWLDEESMHAHGLTGLTLKALQAQSGAHSVLL
jgi:A/G-specific adenine glycosylase